MARYIDADILKEDLKNSYEGLYEIYKGLKFDDKKQICAGQLNTFMECILRVKEQPTADVVEVKRGEWILEHETYGKMMCSVCGKQCPTETKPDPYEDYQLTKFYITSPYCPNCGAIMNGGKEEWNLTE